MSQSSIALRICSLIRAPVRASISRRAATCSGSSITGNRCLGDMAQVCACRCIVSIVPAAGGGDGLRWNEWRRAKPSLRFCVWDDGAARYFSACECSFVGVPRPTSADVGPLDRASGARLRCALERRSAQAEKISGALLPFSGSPSCRFAFLSWRDLTRGRNSCSEGRGSSRTGTVPADQGWESCRH
jgi:hypothetical protein